MDRGGARAELLAFLAVFGALSLALDVIAAANLWRLREWRAGFAAGTRASSVLDRVRESEESVP